MKNVLLVDDHSIVRQGLRNLIALEPDLAVTGEAASGLEAIQVAVLASVAVAKNGARLSKGFGFGATRKQSRKHKQGQHLLYLVTSTPSSPGCQGA